MGLDLTLEQLKEGKAVAGAVEELAETGGDDFLGRINNIISGINTLFENYERLKGKINTRPRVLGKEGQDNTGTRDLASEPLINEDDVKKIVDQRLFQLITTTFGNKFFNIKLSDLAINYSDKTITELMEGFAKEKQPE